MNVIAPETIWPKNYFPVERIVQLEFFIPIWLIVEKVP